MSAPLLPELLDDQARHGPDELAVVGPDRSLTFAALQEEVAAVARGLRARGVGRGDLVGVLLPRTADVVVSVFGILAAGAAVVPVDASYPPDRIATMLADAAPAAVLADSSLTGRTALDPSRLCGLADVRVPSGDRPAPPLPSDLAYVLYTSGSTGKPKGIMIEHRSIANLYASHRDRMFAPATALVGAERLRVAHVAAFSFDASWDPLLWMLAGHTLHIVDEPTRRDPVALTAYLREQRIDFLETTPSYAEQLTAAGAFRPGEGHAPRVLAVGGEAVGKRLWEEFHTRRDMLVFNLYGPSEATVDAVMATFDEAPDPVIGTPVAGVTAYVLTPEGTVAAPGEPGELCLGGAGVGRGYLGLPDLTRERFVPDPFAGGERRMYRTGDIVVLGADGRLRYLDRADQQVKVRGYRVELGEIEAVAARDAAVARAVASVRRETFDGTPVLRCHVVPAPGARPDLEAVGGRLAEALPDYMVPTELDVIDEVPLTPNGKLDRARLAALPLSTLVAADPVAGDGDEAELPPRERLSRIAAGLLGRPVADDQDLFQAGGDSMTAARLVGAARSYGLEVSLEAVFECRTVEALAARVG
ncbi:non-ribosomal peptide synthetase [Streptomyces halobius]|uniref:Non-ribosomal peptide synthetase n=1 Tax=Streptomyces halobius TaxID=2879846 RepID=A0ABY4MI61_9ACTN|nr:non-ribosomal peptide synthetase [Streptomyces halobius]UQA97433.1 non-ribosomal peptide synthetase [Streptomyces halobius]